MAALVFNEMARFDVSSISISVAWKDFVDRSATCSSPHFSVTIDNSADSTLIILANKRKYSILSVLNDRSGCLACVLRKNYAASISKSVVWVYSKIWI